MKDYLYSNLLNKFFLICFLPLLFSGCSKSPMELRDESIKYFDNAVDYYERGYLKNAANLFNEVIKIENELKLSDKSGDCYLYLGLISFENSDYVTAISHYEKAKELFKSKFNRRSQGMADNNIGNIYASLGNIPKALESYRSALLTGQISADKEGEAIALMNIGSLFLENKEFKSAFEYFNRAYNNYEIIGSLDGELAATIKIGESFLRYGSYTDALNTFNSAYTLSEELSLKFQSTEILNYLGIIYFKNGNYSDALTILNSALSQAKIVEDIVLESVILNNIADVYLRQFDYTQAINFYKESLIQNGKSGNGVISSFISLKLASAQYLKGLLEEDKELLDEAKDSFEDIAADFEKISYPPGRLNALSGQMICELELNNKKEAVSLASTIITLLVDNSPSLKNKYSELMCLSPDVFNYNDLYQVLISTKEFKKVTEYSVLFTGYQVRDYVNSLNTIRQKDVKLNEEIENIRLNVREKDFLLLELTNELSKTGSTKNDTKIKNIKDILKEKKEQFNSDKLLAHLYSLYNIKDYTLSSIQKKIGDKKALLTFYIGKDTLHTFIIGKTGIEHKQTFLSESGLKGQVFTLSGAITNNNITEAEPILKGLYVRVFKPLEQSLKKYNEIFILTLNDQSSDLNYIPFHSLIDENSKPISEKWSIRYFGGFKSSSKFKVGMNSVAIFDSLTIKIPNIPEVKFEKASDQAKSKLIDGQFRNLFLFSDVFFSIEEPNNSYLKLSPGNNIEKDIKISEMNSLSTGSINVFNFYSDNSAAGKLFSFLLPGINSITLTPVKISDADRVKFIENKFHKTSDDNRGSLINAAFYDFVKF